MTREIKKYSAQEIKWQIWAAKAFFFIGGFGAATWAPLVPMLRESLQLTDDILGMLLLCVGIGSLLTMPFSGGAASKWGCRRVLVISSVLYGAVLTALSLTGSIWLLVPLILSLGATMGAVDVVVNVFAVNVEKNSGKRVMSGMHAFWSIGGFCGAGIFSIWLNLGLNHFQSVLIADVIILQGAISLAADMLPLPGGLGISEHLFQLIFLPVCGAGLITPAMIISRGLSFYAQLLISAVFTAVAYVLIFGRREKNDRIL